MEGSFTKGDSLLDIAIVPGPVAQHAPALHRKMPRKDIVRSVDTPLMLLCNLLCSYHTAIRSALSVSEVSEVQDYERVENGKN